MVAFYLALRYFTGKSKAGWSQRIGLLPELEHSTRGRNRIWIHAVSAGEVVAAVPIIRSLQVRLPDYELVLSVTTPAGFEMATQQAAGLVSHIFYAPFDLPWMAGRAVGAIRPAAYVSLESEMWPNLLHLLKRSGAITVMVNGRISERSHRRIVKYAKPVFRWMTGNMDRLLVQGDADAERLRSLLPVGKSADSVCVMGNSKFDQSVTRLTPDEAAALKQSLHLPHGSRVFVAGSTRSAEEEQIVLSAYQSLLSQYPDLSLIIAPRQIDRAEELSEAMIGRGLTPVRKTHLPESTGPVSCLILDTMGELANVYAIADITFVGNSFEPVVKGGGQNLLQPLAHGKPVMFGPRIATIRSEADLAKESGVGFQAATVEELTNTAAMLLADPGNLQDISARALALIEANRGVSDRYASAVADLLANRAGSSL